MFLCLFTFREDTWKMSSRIAIRVTVAVIRTIVSQETGDEDTLLTADLICHGIH